MLSDIAVILYKVDNIYNKSSERGIALNDPDLAIDWKLAGTDPLISEKDQNNPPLRMAENNF